MNKLPQHTRGLPAWLSYSISALSFIAYLIQSIIYAMKLPVVMDEAAYLLKGYLFATGQYSPFQANGPWTNKMPLAFLIPGWVQSIFSPGIRTGRIFAIMLSGLILIGLWLVVRRISGKELAALSILILAINPAIIKTYSQVWSQNLVALLLIWSLFFLLGENRKLWHLILGACLAVLTTLIRQNMVFYPLLVSLYIFWQHGKKIGWLTFFSMAAVTILYHMIYAPGILRLWLVWLPEFIQNLFIKSGLLLTAPSVWQPEMTMAHRIAAFWMGLRNNFVFIILFLLLLILTNFKNLKENYNTNFKSAMLLSITLLVLFFSHAYASLGLDYCVFCFTNYIDFFIILVIPLFALTIDYWTIPTDFFSKTALFLASAASIYFIFISNHENQAQNLYRLFETEVPRMKNFQILKGTVPFSTILTNKLGILDFWSYLDLIDILTRYLLVLVIIIGLVLCWWILTKVIKKQTSLPKVTLSVALILGVVFSPSPFLSQGAPIQDCGNTILNMETVGAQINIEVSNGDFVTTYGDSTILPLLYVEKEFSFPPQKINGIYSKRQSDQTDLLPLYGFYNEEIDQAWFKKANLIIVQEKYLKENPLLFDSLNNDNFDELPPTIPLCNSDKDSILHLYTKN